MARLLSLLVAAAFAAVACQLVLGTLFVGAPATSSLRGQAVARQVGTDYLLRNGPKDADGPPVDTGAAAGPQHEVVYKKRPFGIARYAPGTGGMGAQVMEVTPKSRYPGDPQGQAFVAGVQAGWVIKTVNGNDVTKLPLEAIMEMLDDEVLDPVAALSLNLKESGVQSGFSNTEASAGAGSFSVKSADVGMTDFAVTKAELPITVVYAETR
jgi:hypothetical protein